MGSRTNIFITALMFYLSIGLLVGLVAPYFPTVQTEIDNRERPMVYETVKDILTIPTIAPSGIAGIGGDIVDGLIWILNALIFITNGLIGAILFILFIPIDLILEITFIKGIVIGFGQLPTWLNLIFFTPPLIIIVWVLITTFIPTINAGH